MPHQPITASLLQADPWSLPGGPSAMYEILQIESVDLWRAIVIGVVMLIARRMG